MDGLGGAERRHRETFAERRARRAEIDDPEVVLNAAARYLEVRSRSVAEVRRHLIAAGYAAELVEAAVTRLVSLGMLDDATFAAAWLESRDRARPRSAMVLRRELTQKGIDRELIDELLEQRAETDEDPDLAAARRLLARRSAALARIPDERLRRQRAYALLARNGFDPEVCKAALNQL